MADEMPPVVTRLLADISDLEAGLAKGEALVKAYGANVAGSMGDGRALGEKFGKDLGDGIQDAIPAGFTGGPGERIGQDLADGVGRGIEDGAPAVQSKVKETLDKGSEPAKESGSKVGAAFGAAFDEDLSDRLHVLTSKVDTIMGGGGKEAGAAFAVKFGDEAKSGITTGSLINALGPGVLDELAKTSGDRSGFNFTEAMGGRVRGELPDKLEKPIEDSGKKAGAKGGDAAGAGFAGGMSPLILGAFAAVATAGPAVVLAGAATAVLGVEALATKGNANLADSYHRLGADASAALTQATAPLIPQMQASINILDAGVRKVGPELKAVFADVAPDATAITGGFVSLAENVLPGVASGLKAIAPYAHEIGDDFGKIGTGIGGLFQGLGSGAAGGTAGFTALATAIEHLLPDIGSIVGDLSNGLGPALHDVVAVVDVAGAGFKMLADDLPPGAIRATADAVALLYAAFKVGTLTGAIAEGTKFTAWLGVTKTEAAATATEVKALGTAEEATAAKGGLMAAAGGVGAKAIGGLGTAAELATGPLGLIIAGAGLLGNALGDRLASKTALTSAALTSMMQQAADGAAGAQTQVANLAGFLASLPFNAGADGVKTFDQALTQLEATNPKQAAVEYASVADAWEKQGKSASDVAAALPGYTQAVQDAASANQQMAGATASALSPVDQLTQSIVQQQIQTASSATNAGLAAVATLDFGTAQSALEQQLIGSVNGYQSATGAANAYDTVLTALNGTTNTLLTSEASFTIALAGVATAAKSNGTSLDVNDAKGAQNIQTFTGLATAADKAAVSIYQNEVNTKGASVAYQDANNKLAQEKQAFIDAADKAGFNKDAVKALANELYALPPTIPIQVDVSSAVQHAEGLVEWIDSLTGTITVQTKSGSGVTYNPKSGGGKALYDLGGWVDAPVGAPVDAVVHGREYVLSTDMLSGRAQIDPAVVAALAARSAAGPSMSVSAAAAGGYGGAARVTNYNITVQGSLWATGDLMNEVRANSLQYEARNSVNGLSIPA